MSDWIDRTEPLLELMADVPAMFGIDTEFMRVNTFFPRLALIQIVFGERIALIDPLAAIELDGLGAALADSNRLVIMHSASEDLDALATRFVRGVAQLFAAYARCEARQSRTLADDLDEMRSELLVVRTDE